VGEFWERLRLERRTAVLGVVEEPERRDDPEDDA
jgi:hypothetical protein